MLTKLVAKFQKIFDDVEFVEEEETEILKNGFMYMRLVHISPQPNKKLSSIDFLLFVLLTTPTAVVSAAAECYYQYMYRDDILLNDLLEAITVVGSGLNMYITLSWFMYKNQDIANLARKIGSFRRFRKPADFDRANFSANFVTTAMFIYAVLGVIVYTTMSYWQYSGCMKENVELKIDRVCGLCVPTPLPMSFSDGPYYYLIFATQALNIVVVCVAAALVLAIIGGLVMVINSRVRMLKEDISAVFSSSIDDNSRKERLKECVRYHVFLIDLSRDLNNCMSIPCFVQSSFMSIVIALIALQFMMRPDFKTWLHGFGWILVLGILSYGGQIFINETIDIPVEVFHTDWFEHDVETQKYVRMMIMRGNYYFYIDTIFFGPLALTTFTYVVQNAYSLIALLYQQ